MKKIILSFMFLVIAPELASADELSTEFIEKKIRKGDWTVGGEAAISYSSMGGSRLYTNWDAQYFLADRFSAGLLIQLQGGKAFDSSGLGLLATYHFYEGDKTTYYLSAALTHHQYDSEFFTNNSQYATMGTATLGMNYFLNPHVSFGPRLEYRRVLNDNVQGLDLKDYQINMMMGFTFYF
jgi:hypothetical protein